MLWGRRLWTGVLLCSSLLATARPCHAQDLDAKTQALAHYIMAVCHDLNGETSQAINEYRKSVQFDGDQPAPRLKLGDYYLRAGRIQEAARQLKAAVRLSPRESQAHYLLALIYSSQHQYTQAASEYETLLKNASQDDPSDTDVYTYLGQLYYAQGKYPEAIEQFSKILQLEPDNTSALNLLGSVYADTNAGPQAMQTFRRILQIDPDNSEALNSLGYIYAQQNVHLDEALRMVRRAIDIDPSNGAYYDSLGWVLYKKGMYAESLMALEKAQDFIEDEILYDHLGDVFKALKEYSLALQYWRKSLDLDGTQVLVQQKIKELEKCVASRSIPQPR